MENETIAILLAGGKSERMGVAKGLLKYGKTFWILEQVERLSEVGIENVIIGLGHDYQHYFMAINWFEQASKEMIPFMKTKVKVVLNPTPELGAFSTLQTALKVVPKHVNVLINPIDVPILSANAFQKLLAALNTIVMPKYNGKNGHPILLNRSFWPSLLNLNPEENDARLDLQIKKMPSTKISHISVTEEIVLTNLNTPKVWKTFLNGRE